MPDAIAALQTDLRRLRVCSLSDPITDAMLAVISRAAQEAR